jgi:hypothetical protein
VLCGSDEWQEVVVIAVFALLVYVIGMGGLFVRVLLLAPSKFHEPIFHKRWKFLLLKFRPGAWWWGIVILLKGVLLNLALAALLSGLAQLYLMMTVLLVYSAGLMGVSPWRYRAANMFDTAVHGSLILIASLAALFWNGSEGLEETSTAMFAVSFSPFIIGLAASAWQTKNSSRQQTVEKQSFGQAVKAACSLMAEQDELSMKGFMNRMTEHDMHVLELATNVIHAEINGRQPIGGKRLLLEFTSDSSKPAAEVSVTETPSEFDGVKVADPSPVQLEPETPVDLADPSPVQLEPEKPLEENTKSAVTSISILPVAEEAEKDSAVHQDRAAAAAVSNLTGLLAQSTERELEARQELQSLKAKMIRLANLNISIQQDVLEGDKLMTPRNLRSHTDDAPRTSLDSSLAVRPSQCSL